MKISLRLILFFLFVTTGLIAMLWSASDWYELMRGDRVGASWCSMSSYWNCDRAAFSTIGSFHDIPLALFGVVWFAIAGLIGVCANLRRSWMAKAFFSAGVLVALVCWSYLFFILKGGCVVCYLSYICIIGVAITGWKWHDAFALFNRKLTLGLAIAVIALAGLYAAVNIDKMKNLIPAEEFRTWFQSLAVENVKPSPISNGRTSIPFDAPHLITIVEFSDFGCPFCEKTASVVMPFLHHQNDVRIEFYPFPLDSTCNSESNTIHPHSCDWTKLAICAQDQGEFWSMHDQIFKIARTNEHLPPVSEYIDNLSVNDLGALKTCYADAKTADRLRDLIRVGNEMNIQGTPSFFVNGKRVPRYVPIPLWKAILDEARHPTTSKP